MKPVKQFKNYTGTLELVLNLPATVAAEQAVLAGLLMEPDKFYEVSHLLKAEMFSERKYQLIYHVIEKMNLNNMAVDTVTVTQELQRNNCLDEVGGAYEISVITNHIVSALHIESHALIMREQFLRRNVITRCVKLAIAAQDAHTDVEDIMDQSIDFVDQITSSTFSTSRIMTFAEGVMKWYKMIKAVIEKKEVVTELKPTIAGLRRYIPCYGRGHLLIIAARPGMGKTAFVLNELLELAKQQEPALIFSLEMTTEELVKRALMRETHLGKNKIDGYTLSSENWETLDRIIQQIQDSPLIIDETANVTFAYIKTQAKIAVKKHGIKIIAVDYLQLIKTDESIPRERQVAILSAHFKGLAKELDVPVLLIAQLNRGPESRPKDNFEPKLSDLRESGAIEQDADVVMFPHRPEYYYPKDPQLRGLGKIIIAKNRHNPIGSVKIRINHGVSEWVDFEEL